MEPAARKPALGTSSASNILPTQAAQPSQPSKSRLDDIKSELARLNAKRGSNGEPARIESKKVEMTMEGLKEQLEKAKAKIARRDEAIKSLEAKAAKASSSDLEYKLNDLVRRHQESKVKHQAQLSVLQKENQELKSGVAIGAGAQEGLRSTNARLDAEVTSLKQQLEHLNERADPLLSARQGNNPEARTVETENQNRLCKEELEELSEAAEENDRLHNLLSASAIAYRQLSKNSVPLSTYRQLQQRYTETKGELLDCRDRAGPLELELELTQAEVADGQARYASIKAERDVLQAVAEYAREEQAARSGQWSSSWVSGTRDEDTNDLAPSHDPRQLAQLALTHADMITEHLSSQLDAVQDDHIALIKAHDTTLASFEAAQITLTALQRSFTLLETRHAELEKVHEPCFATLSAVRAELASVRGESDKVKRDMAGVCAEMKAVQARARDDREALKRANEVVTRSKMAEDTLDEEVRHLREAYVNAAAFEALYENLESEHAMILARESAAIDEAERLGMENAELVGHVNEGQKINYVEGVRREMFIVKQELATTRHLLNKANDQIHALEDEVNAYKTIEPTYSTLGTSLVGSTRTRVSRRQPEGGQVILRGGRSVSGSAGGRHA
ncbi:hypothetical protein IAU60_006692 [Kwoniella sp. DSM 27419]